jgi:hypothetical protein
MVYRQVRSFTESNQPRQHFLNIQARDSEKRIRQAHGFGGALDSSGEAAEGVLESTGVQLAHYRYHLGFGPNINCYL